MNHIKRTIEKRNSLKASLAEINKLKDENQKKNQKHFRSSETPKIEQKSRKTILQSLVEHEV